MVITKRKFNCILFQAIIIIIQLFVVIKVMRETSDIDYALIFLSWICFLSFLVEMLLWNYLSKELLCPYIVFLSVLFVFCCGQSIGWALGIDLGGQDLWFRHDFGMDHAWLIKGLAYSMLSVSCFHAGAIINYGGEQIRNNLWRSEDVIEAYNLIAKPLLLLCIPAFVVNILQTVLAVATGGYAAYYEVLESRSAIFTLFGYIDDYYEPCLLLLLIANRDKKQTKFIIIGFMLFEAICQLYIGGRSGAVMTVLGIVLAIHYFVRPFSSIDIVRLGTLGYIGLALLNAIEKTRNTIGKGIGDVLNAIGISFFDAIGHFVGELGWSMSSTIWTMMLVPKTSDYRHGVSYLASLLVPIPNIGIWEVHPAKLYANIGDWLEKALNYDHGIGYSMVAESYINFGWFGLIVMFVFGLILVRFLARVKRVNTENDILSATFQILIIMTIMKSLVRSSFSNSMRSIVYVLIPIYLIISYKLNKKMEEIK